MNFLKQLGITDRGTLTSIYVVIVMDYRIGQNVVKRVLLKRLTTFRVAALGHPSVGIAFATVEISDDRQQRLRLKAEFTDLLDADRLKFIDH
jgi:hypothetical protein